MLRKWLVWMSNAHWAFTYTWPYGWPALSESPLMYNVCLFVCLYIAMRISHMFLNSLRKNLINTHIFGLLLNNVCLFIVMRILNTWAAAYLNSLRAENKLCSSAGSSHDPTFVVTTALDNTSKTDVAPWCYKWIGLVGIRVGWSILAGLSHFFVEDMYWNDRSLLTELPESSSRSVTEDHFQCNLKK